MSNCEHNWEVVELEEGNYRVDTCMNCQVERYIDLVSGLTYFKEPIRCPKCQSTNWDCWDERSFNCWDADGLHAGTKIVGYLRCKDCGTLYTDVSVDPGDDCECDED